MFSLFQFSVLQFEPTTACNLNCEICLRGYLKRPVSFLSFDRFKRVLDSYKFTFVSLHGWGEPLLNTELFKMIKYASLKGVITELTTNGTLIGKNIDRIFESGLSEIAIGAYSMDAFSEILPQAKDLIRAKRERSSARPKTYLDITVCKSSLDQIPDLARLAASTGFDAVILHRLFDGYGVGEDIKYISNEEEDALFAEMRLLVKQRGVELHLPQSRSRPCYVVRHSVFVDAEGRVTPCCFLPEYFLGHTSSLPLDKIMRSRKYKSFIKGMKEYPVCTKCRW